MTIEEYFEYILFNNNNQLKQVHENIIILGDLWGTYRIPLGDPSENDMPDQRPTCQFIPETNMPDQRLIYNI